MKVLTKNNKVLTSANKIKALLYEPVISSYPVYPVKGDIINMTLGNSEGTRYRVLSGNGTTSIVKVAAMWYTAGTCIGCASTYEGSALDTYLNTTWYGNLSSAAKTAIVASTMTCDTWTRGSQVSPWYIHGTTNYGNRQQRAALTRNVYAFNITEIWNYYELSDGATVNLDTFKELLNFTQGYPWLSSQYPSTGFSYCIYYEVGSSYKPAIEAIASTPGRPTIPVFSIDLSKIQYTKE